MTCDYCKLPRERNQTDAHCKGCGAPMAQAPAEGLGPYVMNSFAVPTNPRRYANDPMVLPLNAVFGNDYGCYTPQFGTDSFKEQTDRNYLLIAGAAIAALMVKK